jgi:hypothetical protein
MEDPYNLRGPGPPAGGDRNRGPSIVGIAWMETGMSIVAAAARFWGRYIIRQTSWDDWLMLVTLVRRTLGKQPTKKEC